jgi:polyvinyl alcohol dehydrogenase (cytochrome)
MTGVSIGFSALAAAPAVAADGQAVYGRVCAACHAGGVEKAPQRAMLGQMTADSIHRALTTGVMKPMAQSLTDDERVAVAEYLSGHKLGEGAAAAPGPACRGRAAVFSDASAPWSGWGIDLGNTRSIPADVAGLSRADVPRLEVDWVRRYPNALRARSQPGFAGGAVFEGSHDGTVYALDEQTGCVRWTFRAPAEVRTGIVVGPGKAPVLYFGTLIGDVFALDAHSGKLLWRSRPDPHPNATITATPTLYDGRLYVAVSSLEVLAAEDPKYSCCSFRGSVVAYDARSGERLWQTHSIPAPPSPQKPNARGVMQFGPSGAPVWGTPSIDVKRRRLYIGTGENYSAPANDRSDAIIAMDLATGKIAWVYQALKGDVWNGACRATGSGPNCPEENGPDADFGAATILATTSDGRDLVVAGQKSGTVYAMDPDTGTLVWKTQASRGGGGGGIRFGMAVSGDRVFVPAGDSESSVAGAARFYTGPARPGLYALDLRTGAPLWSAPSEDVCAGRPLCHPGITNAIIATPDMVLTAGMDGWLRIVDAANGKLLWKFDAARSFPALNGGIATGGSFSGGAGPVVYHGRIYLNSGYGFGTDKPGNLLLTLKPQR